MSRMLYDGRMHTELFSFQWRGIGTPEVESLQSAFRRIAFAHRVTPGILFDRYFKPGLKSYGLMGNGNPLSLSARSFSIAGNSVVLRHVAEEIKRLTGERNAVDAALCNLTALLGPKALAIRSGQFCPLCITHKSASHYGRALWEFRAIRACSKHKAQLVTPHCGSDQAHRVKGPWAIQLDTLCHQCGMPGMRCQVGEMVDADASEIWAASEIGKVLAYASGGGRLSGEQLRMGIAQCVAITGHWKDDEMNEVGLTFHSVDAWMKARARPSLQGLLALASCVGTALLDIFRGSVGKRRSRLAVHYAYFGVEAKYAILPSGSRTVRDSLLTLIADSNGSPISGTKLAKKLGVSTDYLRMHFPDEWAECLRVREQARRREAVRRKEELLGLVTEAGKQAWREGYWVTNYRIRQYMGQIPSRYGSHEISAAIAEVLNKALNHLRP